MKLNANTQTVIASGIIASRNRVKISGGGITNLLQLPTNEFVTYVRGLKKMRSTTSIWYRLLTVFLRAALVIVLLLSGWAIYSKLPHQNSAQPQTTNAQTALQIELRMPADNTSNTLQIEVELYPFDIVAAHHEYFTERRAGKRLEDFVNERMKGSARVTARLDPQGKTTVMVDSGTWWLRAQLSGEENLEWRLPLNVAGLKQTVELTPQNIYTRTRSF